MYIHFCCANVDLSFIDESLFLSYIFILNMSFYEMLNILIFFVLILNIENLIVYLL